MSILNGLVVPAGNLYAKQNVIISTSEHIVTDSDLTDNSSELKQTLDTKVDNDGVKTINGTSVLGTGDVAIGPAGTVTVTVTDQSLEITVSDE